MQRATYGRLLEGRPDVLPGYALAPLAVTDPEVVRISGASVHMIARRTGNDGARIAGVVFRITTAELEATDAYVVDAYARVLARLVSGEQAHVYVGLDA